MNKINEVKTSVIVPVYNTEKYLRECLDSLLRQTHKEMQVIIVNDGSTDKSMQVVNEYVARFENLIIVNQENKGLSAARNAGIKASQGQFIYFLDSDDFIDDDTLESCYQCAQRNNLDLVLFDAVVLSEKGIEQGNLSGKYDRRNIIKNFREKYNGRIFLETYMLHSPDIVSAALMYVRKSFIVKHRLFFFEGIVHEDEEFRFRLMMANPSLMYLPRLFYHRRYRAGSIMVAPIEHKRLEDYIFALEQMIIFADAKDKLAMIYIARKIWSAFVRYENLVKAKDNNVIEIKRKLYKVFLNYHSKFYKIIKMKDHIFYDYQAFLMSEISDYEKYDELYQKRKEILYHFFSQLPLNCTKKTVGIYGLGFHTEKFLNEYQTVVGKIKSDIVFIDSSIKTNSVMFSGCQVYHVSDIQSLSMKEVIISSYLHERDMTDKLKSLYGNQYEIYSLYKNYPFSLLTLI